MPKLFKASRRGDWSQTFTGKKFYTLDPAPDDICLEDVAHALSMSCRFNGHCSRFYSVAQHSVLVSYLMGCGIGAEKELSEHQRLAAARAGLLHDAAEAYIPDLTRPLKLSLREAKQPFFDDAEKAIVAAVELRFDVQVVGYRPADDAALYLEAPMLVPHYRDWTESEALVAQARDVLAKATRSTLSVRDANAVAEWAGIPEIPTSVAKDAFLRRAHELGISSK